MFLEWYDTAFKISFLIIGCLFALSSIDELIMIVSFIIFRVFKAFSFNKKHKVLTVEDLEKESQKPVAVMVACWNEEGVIFKMLENAVKSIKYKNYHIFVGTYPNDLKTQVEVERATQIHKHIHQVVLDHDGPSTKSDNVNFIWKSIKDFEKRENVLFDIFVIHDAEDFVPEYGLSIFNHLIPRKDIVQLPVLPIKVPWHQFTAGTYMDEFAHLHLIGLRTREWLSGNIPTAGVGCGFSRDFLEFANQHNNSAGPLGLNTLTEDYELPLINRRKEENEAFYDSIVIKKGAIGGWVDYIPAVRSHFPKSFRSAVKQKSRWLLGITLQGTDHLGWKGDFSFKYMLFRDRKPIVTNLLTFVGLIYVLLFALDYFLRGKVHYDNMFSENIAYQVIIYLNVFVMFVLLFARILCTTIVYGLVHGILSVPRIFWGNLINGVASIRAIRIYRKTKRENSKPRWDKTTHEI